MSAITVDKFDLQLLAALQKDGQATNSVLGELVHLSTSQVSRRIQRLQEARVIDHYCAVIEPSAIGLDVVAFTEVTLNRHDPLSSERFEKGIVELPQVLECYQLAGQADYLLRTVAPDLASFSSFMNRHVLRIPGVANVKSTVTLRKVKHTHVLPLDHVMEPAQSRKKVYFSA
jgi:Lrp/AsnC family leucine-responsive transcriptional regulator